MQHSQQQYKHFKQLLDSSTLNKLESYRAKLKSEKVKIPHIFCCADFNSFQQPPIQPRAYISCLKSEGKRFPLCSETFIICFTLLWSIDILLISLIVDLCFTQNFFHKLNWFEYFFPDHREQHRVLQIIISLPYHLNGSEVNKRGTGKNKRRREVRERERKTRQHDGGGNFDRCCFFNLNHDEEVDTKHRRMKINKVQSSEVWCEENY